MKTITSWMEDIHQVAIEHGWWEERRPIPEMLCLIHSEVSEALEAYRIDDMVEFEVEMADIAIRLFDMAEGLGIDLEAAIAAKHEINKERPYKHGKRL